MPSLSLLVILFGITLPVLYLTGSGNNYCTHWQTAVFLKNLKCVQVFTNMAAYHYPYSNIPKIGLMNHGVHLGLGSQAGKTKLLLILQDLKI